MPFSVQERVRIIVSWSDLLSHHGRPATRLIVPYACALRMLTPDHGSVCPPLLMLICPESRRPCIIPLGMACPRPARTLRHLRDIDMGLARSRDLSHVRRANGV